MDFDMEPSTPNAGAVRKEVKGFALYDDFRLYCREREESSPSKAVPGKDT